MKLPWLEKQRFLVLISHLLLMGAIPKPFKTTDMTPGTWIKKLRMNKELKQAYIAKKLGITQQAYSKIENSVWIRKGRLPELLNALDSNFEELKRVAAIFNLPDFSEMELNEPEESMRA